MATTTLLGGALATGRGAVFPSEAFRFMTFEVSGDATTFALAIEGTGWSTPYALNVTNLNTGATTNSITANGLYRVDVTGISGIGANLTSVSGGTNGVTVMAKFRNRV